MSKLVHAVIAIVLAVGCFVLISFVMGEMTVFVAAISVAFGIGYWFTRDIIFFWL